MASIQPRPGRSTDGVLLAILNKRLDGIVRKMQSTLFRTGRSGVINTARDFSCCILTSDAELLATGESLPIHVMVGADMMARSVATFHPELRRGDAFLHNSVYHGCSHAADQSILIPVIDDDGEHRFTVMTKAHQADIGNSIPTTYHATAHDVYEEGAPIFPAVKVQRDYADIGDIIRMCMLRIRVSEQWRGDYLAALGAARIGERELLGLGAEVGWGTLTRYVEDWFDYSEQRMIAVLRELPSGRATSRSVHDPFPGTSPEGIPVQAHVEVDGEAARITVDLRDNPDCLPCGLNLSEACARTGAMVGVFNSLDKEVPPNAGSFRRITVRLRENCVVGIPRHPTSCSVATTNVADRVPNAVQRAIAELGDGYGMAEVGATMTAAHAVVSGIDPRNGKPFVNQICLGMTCGAAAASEDCWLTTFTIGSAGLVLLDSVEIDELKHPIRVQERNLVPDSEGAGRFCGAPSALVELGPVDCDIRFVYGSDGCINPPLGARGGLSGAAARNWLRKRSGALVEMNGWVDVTVAPGETMIGISCGGGGYSSPIQRNPLRVKRDVDEGYISERRAKTVYGVVLDGAGTLDAKATRSRRASMDQL